MLHHNESVGISPEVAITPTAQKKESFSAIGTVTICPFSLVDGQKVYRTDEFTKHNLIVRKGRATLIDMILGTVRKKLKFIRWGKGGALAFPLGDPLNPLDVSDDDEDVKDFLLDKVLGTPTRISPTEVQFTETIISDEVNNDVNEAAMIFEDMDTFDRSIFARITFPTVRLTVEKGSGIEIRWQFSFNRSEETP